MSIAEYGERPAGGRGVLEGAFALLEELERMGEAGLTQLTLACGLPKSTAHRLLTQLAELGAVERHAGSYRIGPRMARYGRAWQPCPALRAAARLPMRRLAALTRAGVALTVPAEGEVLVIAAVRAGAELVPQRPGMTFPMMSAAGQAIAAAEPGTGLPAAYSAATWPYVAERIRRDGVAVETGELVPGVACVAAPVRTPDGTVGAVSALVEATRRLDELVEAVRRTARAISPCPA